MDNWLERSSLLVKEEGLKHLQQAHVLVVGLGGVGSFAAEFIARSGIGSMTIVDGDEVDNTNRNRQLPALVSTVGKPKVQVMAERLLDINPELKLEVIQEFLNPERMEEVLTSHQFDYVMDCIDSISPKIELIVASKRNNLPLISVMGAGGKYDPTKLTIRDISNTTECLLAKTVRKRLKKLRISHGVRCVFSTETPDPTSIATTDGTNFKKSYYGTISYMPAAMGLLAASEVIRRIIKSEKE